MPPGRAVSGTSHYIDPGEDPGPVGLGMSRAHASEAGIYGWGPSQHCHCGPQQEQWKEMNEYYDSEQSVNLIMHTRSGNYSDYLC